MPLETHISKILIFFQFRLRGVFYKVLEWNLMAYLEVKKKKKGMGCKVKGWIVIQLFCLKIL